jgi:cardiolipin-specific phospholipase
VLDEWRRVLKIKKFCLAGHSFGGYIAALFAAARPECINQLFLLSPAGTTNYTEEEIA